MTGLSHTLGLEGLYWFFPTNWDYLTLPKGCREQNPGITLPGAHSDNTTAAPTERNGLELKKLEKWMAWENVFVPWNRSADSTVGVQHSQSVIYMENWENP